MIDDRSIVKVSAAHVHLSNADASNLFPGGLTKLRELGQPGEWACKERVFVYGPHEDAIQARVLWPCRDRTQVEISRTQARKIHIDAPVRASGDLDGTPGCTIRRHDLFGLGVRLDSGVIVAQVHVHVPESFGIAGGRNGDLTCASIEVRSPSGRWTLDKIPLRVSPTAALEVHVDTDQANAMDLANAQHVRLSIW